MKKETCEEMIKIGNFRDIRKFRCVITQRKKFQKNKNINLSQKSGDVEKNSNSNICVPNIFTEKIEPLRL